MKIVKIIKKIAIILVVIAFVLFPLPNSDLYFRVYFTNADPRATADIEGGTCALYYAVGSPNAFSGEQVVQSDINQNSHCATFKLDGSLAGKLTGLRFDFPNNDTLVCIYNITVSSAGIIQKQFNPCDFFVDENLIQINDIQDISLGTAMNRAYIKTGSTDPYVVFSDSLVAQITDGYSSYRLTRLCICLFIAAVYFMAKKNLFSKAE